VDLRSSSRLFLVVVVSACLPSGEKQFVVLAEEVQLEEGVWIDVPAPEPLRTPSDEQEVCFEVVRPVELADHPMAILDSSGKPVTVRVEALAVGDRLVLESLSYIGPRTACLGARYSVGDRSFERVRIQASAAIEIRAVEWHSTAKW